MVDACGNLLEIIITTGKVNDVSVAPELIAAVDLGETEAVSADKGYDSDNCVRKLRKKAAKPIFPINATERKRTRIWIGIFIKSGIWLRMLLPV